MFPQPHVRVDLYFAGPEREHTCTLWYNVAGEVPTPENITLVADEMDGFFEESLKNVLPTTTCFYEGCRVWFRDADTELEGISTTAPVAGVVAGEMLPEHNAVVIRRKTAQPGRSKRGRIFLPCVPELFQANGRLTPTGIAKYKLVAQEMQETRTIPGTDVSLVPMTPDWKNGILVLMRGTQVVVDVLTRRDRTNPKRPSVVGVPLEV